MTPLMPRPEAAMSTSLTDALITALKACEVGRKQVMAVPASLLFRSVLTHPSDADRRLLDWATDLDLTEHDVAAIALATALETNPEVARLLRKIQGDAFGPWPAQRTVQTVLTELGVPSRGPLPDLERAFSLGVLIRVGDRAPAPEDRFALSPAVMVALGLPVMGSGISPLPAAQIPDDWTTAATGVAQTLTSDQCFVLSQGDAPDKRAFVNAIGAALGRKAMDVTACPHGADVAAVLGHWLPVHEFETTPGARSPVPPLPAYSGPRVAIIGPDGGLDPDPRWNLIDGHLPKPAPSDDPLWSLGPTRARSVEARIAAQPAGPTTGRRRAALGEEYRTAMEPHAQLISATVAAKDFIAPAGTKADLDILLARCLYAQSGCDDKRHGVKALLSGPSGTGKTLAASYLSTTLGLPLFRLDLSTVVSKYIGETEENLSQILTHAETGPMILLMDEADSLFASRTDVSDGSSRFANNQTNFLLTRFESFAGLAILTSNNPEKFDPAFARRLDQVIEMAAPTGGERRAILAAHLGPDHGLAAAELNAIAAHVDLTGGHLRNIVHTARVLAAAQDQPIALSDMRTGIALEFKKIGRTPPAEFS